MDTWLSPLPLPRKTRLPGWWVALGYMMLVAVWSLLLLAAGWPAGYMWFLSIPILLTGLRYPRPIYGSMTLVLIATALWVGCRISSDWTDPLKASLLASFSVLGLTEVIHRLITAQGQAEARLQRRNRELAALTAVTASTATLDLDQVLQRLVDTVEETFPQTMAATLQLLDERDGTLRTRAASASATSDASTIIVFQPGKGVTGLALAERRTINVADVTSDPRYLPGPVAPRYRSLLVAPLMTRQRVWGTLSVESLAPGAFQARDEQLVESLAQQAAIAIENARLFERVRTAEIRYRALFEDSSTPIAILDAKGNLVDVNPTTCYILGRTRQEMLGRSVNILMSLPEQHFCQALEHVLKGEVFAHEFSVTPADGKIRYFEARVERVDYADKSALQWIAHDITQQRELGHWREELSGIVVHNLRNPLTWVKSGAEMARMFLPQDTDPDVFLALDMAIKGADRLEQQIDVLLNISRAEAGQTLTDQDWLSPTRLVADVVELLGPRAATQDILLQSELPESLPMVLGNRNMLALTLENLVDNAIKFSPPGESVNVLAHASPSTLHISVTDRGPGVDPAEREHIFEKFYQVSGRRSKGAGLGLHFCKLAIEAHSGRIWAQDNGQAQGSTFSFTLPLEVDEPHVASL